VKLSQRRLARPSLGGMLATRQGSLIVAVLCAVCAAGILMFALTRYKSHLRTTTPQATVLVATSQIAQGTTGSMAAAEKLYKSTPVVATQVTPGAISDAAAISAETAATTILPGQQLTSADFSAVTGVAETLAPNMRAISVSIGEANGATDLLQTGDHVDLYSEYTEAAGRTLVLVDPDVLVLKPASATPVKTAGATIAGADMELEVSSAKVAQIIYSADNGQIYLALRPPHADTTPAAQTNLSSVLTGTQPAATNAGGSGASSNRATTTTGTQK
jgi:Flp pilus assembly protein CpaB